MCENSLKEILLQDWPKLCDLYVNKKAESNAFILIKHYIDLVEKDKTVSAKLYSLNGDWKDGTFVLLYRDFYIMFNTCADSQDRLLTALKCLNQKQPYLFSGFPDRLKPTIERFASAIGLRNDSVQFQTTLWQHITAENALKFDTEPPDGITLSKLRQEDVAMINSIWPHRHKGSEVLMSQIVAYNENIGGYDEVGNLVAWCLILPIGALGHLHVKESHKRKGLGSLMVRVLSKKLAKKGLDPTAAVVKENNASRTMFKKLGFKEIDIVHWLDVPAVVNKMA